MRRRGYITPPKAKKEQKVVAEKAKKPKKTKKEQPDGGQDHENTE